MVSYHLATSEEVYELRDVMGSVGLAGALGVTWFYDKLKPCTMVLIAWGAPIPCGILTRNELTHFSAPVAAH